MRFHELKCWPEGFAAVRLGFQTAEVRPDDRAFREEDYIHLREWEPTTEEYSGHELLLRIKHIQRLDEEPFEGFPQGWVMLSIFLVD